MRDIPQSFSDAMLCWYERNARDLLWRYPEGEKPDPYRVWLSEIMLQQTTVQAVKEYFQNFTKTFPDIYALAEADREKVMAMWSGLGYYSRARNLHKCAIEVVSKYNGVFPDNEKDLKALPGIGDYTAAAILAIAFDKKAVVVDGNVERIISRVFEIDTPLPKGKKAIKEKTSSVWPKTRHSAFAQSLMDLGATVCTPKNPRCDLCPVHDFCGAFKKGTMETYPFKAKKKKVPQRKAAAFVFIRENQDKNQYEVLMRQRPENGMLAGLTEVPCSPWSASQDVPKETWMDYAPFQVEWQKMPAPVRHVFSHVKLDLHVYVCRKPVKGYNLREGETWVKTSDLLEKGIPTVMKKVLLSAGIDF